MFNQLPDLRSIEPVNQHKYSPLFNHHTQQPTLTNYFTPTPPQQPPFPPLPPPPAKLSGTELAYKRRRTLSDKTRSLQKLLPVDRKMDMATIYEETYKYIMFLKAQISVLESMPVVSCSSSSSCLNLGSGNPRYGGLGKLNRQQVLEVMVNSPVSQSVLYSRGCCVYSLEQLMLFKEVAEKRFR
ncbi:putative transcription factor bHLH family [Helianthus annuus]|uniref:Putative myc-type, basic helix-loop-helix (BHLH) domain-containing protein n=1 Tax=Helianthus annuus TaxID=4232 RepID=A0A251S997_HELAN|nr:putative transcription factor bHLH family [Helianthus annuus]KAJ0451153.1 putative transcription factor bHLH family [Helianthus annuus]KAJ0455570.1 putative transcription factor bHLH family [Helianthus annuus]KAJ0473024.1 putative transcription factor bHLH family [Helianthus annuus]KAJ0648627.1 putative transcription factor bHLH family [Helianthus annuus]